jgi:hypothetical protein
MMLFWCRLQPANPDLFIGNTRDIERKHRQTLKNADILIPKIVEGLIAVDILQLVTLFISSSF